MIKTRLLGHFKNSDGKIVIWQSPNLPLLGWGLARIIAMLLEDGTVKTGFSHLATAFIFTWAYLEIRSGVNIFRKLLGTIVLVLAILSIFF
jgi:hypothetical protein